MNRAIDYFLNQLPTQASESFRAYFNFVTNDVNSSVIINKSGDPLLSGVIKPSVGNFWSQSGSGFFSGNRYLEITGIGNYGIDNKDLTINFVYENKNIGGSTLISTVETGIFESFDEFGNTQNNLIYKGFEFGVTSNNRLFFEYFRDNGPNIFISDFTLSDKNSIYLNITENNLDFGYYDFFKNRLISNNYYILTEYLFDYSNIWVGRNPSTTGLYNLNKTYTGYVDEFLIFSPAIYPYDLVNINSGLAHIYNSGGVIVETNLVTGITGYASGINSYSTGVTGIVLIPTGVLTNEWGVEYTGYLESGITGLVPVFGISGLTGILAFEQITGLTGESVVKNDSYINSFGKNFINLLSKIDTEDIVEINLITGIGGSPLYKNINLNYQRYIGNFTISEDLDNIYDPIVYVNGQLHHSGIFYNTGNIYNLSAYILNDYYVDSANNFIFSNNYNENDSVFIDLVTGYNSGLVIENFQSTGQTSLTGWDYNLFNFYFNGQKLTQGFNFFTGSGSNIILFNNLFSGSVGKLLGIPKSATFIATGSKNTFYINNSYLNNFSQVFKNGIRQTLQNDYIELARIDSNTGLGFFDFKSDIIYNNDDLFNF